MAKTSVVLALLACLLSVMAFLGAGDRHEPVAHASVGRLSSRVDLLDQRLQILQELIASQSERALSPTVVSRQGEDSSTSQETLTSVQEEMKAALQRLEQLEEKQQGLNTRGEHWGRMVSFSGFNNESEDAITGYRTRALDSGNSVEDRLAALKSLRFSRIEEPDARTPDVVASMIDLVQTSADAGVRADIYRQLDGVTDPNLLQPLLDSLANDEHPEVREEAAETLAKYLPDDQVDAALRHAEAHDEDEGVREQAAESLSQAEAR